MVITTTDLNEIGTPLMRSFRYMERALNERIKLRSDFRRKYIKGGSLKKLTEAQLMQYHELSLRIDALGEEIAVWEAWIDHFIQEDFHDSQKNRPAHTRPFDRFSFETGATV